MVTQKRTELFFLLGMLISLHAYTVLTMIGLSRDVFGIDTESGILYSAMLIEIICIAYFLIHYKAFLYKNAIVSVIFLWVIVVSFSCFNNLDNAYADLWKVLMWPLVFSFFYSYNFYNPSSQRLMVTGFSGLTINSSVLFYLIASFRNQNTAHEGLTVILTVYFVLLTLPWVLLIRRDTIRIFLIIIIAASVVFSAKRAGIISLTGSLLVYFIVEYRVKVGNRFRVMTISILVVMLGFIGFKRINQSYDDQLSRRFTETLEDKGSGRLDIYIEVFELQGDALFMNWILGHGHNEVIKRTKTEVSSHNDWQEVLFDYGLIALFIYFGIHLLLVRWCIYLWKARSPFAPSFATSYFIFFVLSAVSHLILYHSYFIFLVAYWGFIIGSEKRDSLIQ